MSSKFLGLKPRRRTTALLEWYCTEKRKPSSRYCTLKTGYMAFCTEKACTGKISKQQVQKALADTVPTGYRDRISEMG